MLCLLKNRITKLYHICIFVYYYYYILLSRDTTYYYIVPGGVCPVRLVERSSKHFGPWWEKCVKYT